MSTLTFNALIGLFVVLACTGMFFFATTRFRERVLTTRRPAIKPPHASQYVKHIQDLLTHGLAAERPGVRKRA